MDDASDSTGFSTPQDVEFDADLDAQSERLRRGDRPSLFDGDDMGRIRSFLEDQLRERPLPTLALAVAAGWLAGKLLK